ncbi:probable adenylate kinase 7, mitochondrial [Corylus avellana]|uniref:probable adenylate kinase 7, mitochondrial n=1 Tax=Corylus avellana TaxID=13451 RepID=UPI00286D498A|nr:probable adenylate kinase 7, mitochondrial [Corylus avellana]
MIGLSRLITVTATPPLFRLARLALSRFYSPSASAATQPQADYYYYGAESESERLAAAAMADSEGSGPNRGVQWVFIGNPGAKRHVYAVRLAKLLEVPHISMASLVRQDLSPRSALYKQIANAVNHGELVPEDIIFGLLSKRLEDGYYQGENGFILDGIPRSPIQAGILDQLAEIDLVVNFKCTEDCLVKHQRDGTWKEKLQVYAKQSKPLEEYYSKQKKLLDFQVGSAHGETWRGLLAALQLQHIYAACSSHKLTTGFDWL